MENREGERLFEEVIESSWDVIFEDGSLKLLDQETVLQEGIDINDVEKFGKKFGEKFLVCALRDAIRFRLSNFYSEVEGGEEIVVERFSFEAYSQALTRMVEPMLNGKQMKIFEYGMKKISKIDMENFLGENYEFDKFKVNKVCHSETESMKKSFEREVFVPVLEILSPLPIGFVLGGLSIYFDKPELFAPICFLSLASVPIVMIFAVLTFISKPSLNKLKLDHLYNKNYLFEVLRKFDGFRDFEVGALSRNLSEFATEVLEFKDGAGVELNELGTRLTDIKRSLFDCMQERFTLPDFEEDGEVVEEQQVPEQVLAAVDRGEI